MTYGITKITKAAIATLLFLLPWQTILIISEPHIGGYKWQYGTLGIHATEILLFVTFGLFAYWAMTQKQSVHLASLRHGKKEQLFWGSLVLFIAYLFLSMLWAPAPLVALQHAIRFLEAGMLFVMLLYGPLRMYGIVLSFGLGMTIQAGIGIWQFLTQSSVSIPILGLVDHQASTLGTSVIDTVTSGRWLRAYAGFPHPNIFGGYLVVSMFLLSLIRHISHEMHHRIGLDVLMYLQLIALFTTFSRSGWIGFGVIVFSNALFISYKHAQNQFDDWARSLLSHVVVPVLLMLVLGAMYFPLIATRAGDTQLASTSVSERMSGYKEAVYVLASHPWIGTGIGNYTATLAELFPGREGWMYQPVHNIGLLLAAELGIIGMTIFVLVLIAFCWYQYAYIFRRHSWYVAFSLVLFLGLYVSLTAVDHYSVTTYAGLLLSGIFFAALFRTIPHVLHNASIPESEIA